MENLENVEQEAPKKRKPKAKKKEPKVELKERLLDIIDFVDSTVKENRGKSLNTSTCARLNRIKIDLQSIIRTIN